MKIKKGLALILALVMIITLMPTMAFATTTNTVPRVVTVAADDGMPTTTIDLETKDDWGTNTQTIRLTLNNATWTEEPNKADGDTIQYEDENGNTKDILRVTAVDDDNNNIPINIDVDFISAGENAVEFSMTAQNELEAGDVVTLTIINTPDITETADVDESFAAMTSGSEEGAVQVVIDGMDSQVSSSTITVANVATSTTTASVTGTVRTFPRGEQTGAMFEIRETAVNSLPAGSEQIIRLTLPREVTWEELEFGGNLVSGTPTWEPVNNNDRIIDVTFTVDPDPNVKSDEVRQVLTITPTINIGRDAAEGDIAVSITGRSATKDGDEVAMVSDANDLVIATYGNESVEFSTVEEVPTIVSGYVQDTRDRDFTVSVTMEETMLDSLTSGRYVDFDLPEEVQISGPIKVKIGSASSAVATRSIEIEGTNDNNPISAEIPAQPATDEEEATPRIAGNDTSGFSFLVPGDGVGIGGSNTWSGSRANTITFEIPVTVEAGFTGDITMNISGSRAGVSDTELVVATAEPPITVEATTTNVKNGVQTQAVADITITENFAGYIDENCELLIDVNTLGLSQSMVFESFDSIEVTEGNLELGKCDTRDEQIVIPIESVSTTASTIELKGLTMALNRTLPEGGYDLEVSGEAVVKNSLYNDGDFSEVAATVEDYVVITTPADDSAGINATFTDGQASYTLNGETIEMDVAPYIDSNNRMLVPIRFAANAMGVSDENIQWNSYTQTGTISGAMGVVRVTVGSTNLITSNGTITMDTVAVNTNDRIYVPVRYIANALGASVSWDPATRTATFS